MIAGIGALIHALSHQGTIAGLHVGGWLDGEGIAMRRNSLEAERQAIETQRLPGDERHLGGWIGDPDRLCATVIHQCANGKTVQQVLTALVQIAQGDGRPRRRGRHAIHAHRTDGSATGIGERRLGACRGSQGQIARVLELDFQLMRTATHRPDEIRVTGRWGAIETQGKAIDLIGQAGITHQHLVV